LNCRIRGEPVADLPEERVRQDFLHHMISRLGFPVQSLAVEKALHQFPHLSETPSLPDCRVDIVCFAKGIHPEREIAPLLIVECKAVPLTRKVLEQVVGYNFYCEAPFIAVVNQDEVSLGYLEGGEYTYIDYLPSYKDLLRSLRG